MASRSACRKLAQHVHGPPLVGCRLLHLSAAQQSSEAATLPPAVLSGPWSAIMPIEAGAAPVSGAGRLQHDLSHGITVGISSAAGFVQSLWMAVPKKKSSPARKGMRRQHQQLKPMHTVAQCGVCGRCVPARAVVSNCRIPVCPCGPPKLRPKTEAAPAEEVSAQS